MICFHSPLAYAWQELTCHFLDIVQKISELLLGPLTKRSLCRQLPIQSGATAVVAKRGNYSGDETKNSENGKELQEKIHLISQKECL